MAGDEPDPGHDGQTIDGRRSNIPSPLSGRAAELRSSSRNHRKACVSSINLKAHSPGNGRESRPGHDLRSPAFPCRPRPGDDGAWSARARCGPRAASRPSARSDRRVPSARSSSAGCGDASWRETIRTMRRSPGRCCDGSLGTAAYATARSEPNIAASPNRQEPRMRVLVIGSGGREHALCWAIAGSPLLTKLWCAPGNPGIAQVSGMRVDRRAGFSGTRLVRAGQRDRPGGARPRGAAGRRHHRCDGSRRHRVHRTVTRGGAARRQQGVHQGIVRRRRHSDRAMGTLRRRGSRARIRSPPRCANRGEGRRIGGGQGRRGGGDRGGSAGSDRCDDAGTVRSAMRARPW